MKPSETDIDFELFVLLLVGGLLISGFTLLVLTLLLEAGGQG